MRLAAGLALFAGGIYAQSARPVLPRGYHVTACLEPHGPTTARVEFMASKIFAGIGLTLDWKDYRSCADDGAIRIALQKSTPPAELPDALAYSLPNEAGHITVFYDRVGRAM